MRKEKYVYKMKGRSGFKLLRKMFRLNDPNETIELMNGKNRGEKRHSGYPTMGAYTKEGFKLTKPKQLSKGTIK